MSAMTRLRLAVALAVATLFAAPATASAATISGTYWIRGAEYYATATEGRFSGTASGSAGDWATWQATVYHTPITNDAATITGGTARLVTSNLVYLRGRFDSGSLWLDHRDPGCGREYFGVRGKLRDVTRSDSGAIGTGQFRATLIHYRTSILGRCITYSATVSGRIDLEF